MDSASSSFTPNSKRPLDPTTTTTSMDPTATTPKRRHLSSTTTTTEQTVFRLLCPSSLIPHLRPLQLQSLLHISSENNDADHCVVHILNDVVVNDNGDQDQDCSPAQQALLKVFETMAMAKPKVVVGDDENEEVNNRVNDPAHDHDHDPDPDPNLNSGGTVCCRLLAGSNQVGCVLGRGGKIVEKIRQESGAQVRVLPRDHHHSHDLIQITGNFSAVKKALLSVSSCLQDNPRVDAANSGSTKPSLGALHGTPLPPYVDIPQRGYAPNFHAADYRSRGYSSVPGPENIGAGHRMAMEEEVVFKLLCQLDKVGSLIGKGGCIIRALQSETGASIKIADSVSDSDERVVVISARENSEQKHSPAQEAVIRVHCRIAEIGFEPGAAVVARLLVHSQQIGCLLGKGGFIITEMRRATGASIRIFSKEQVPKCGSPNDEVVQVIGNMQSVQDALFHITGRLRETIFPMKPPPPNFSAPPYMSPFPEMPPPLFRPRHNPASPGSYPSPVGHPHGVDRSAIPSQPLDHQPTFSHGMDRSGPSNMDRVPYPYGSERPGHGPTFDRPSSSPRSWNPQAVSSGNNWGTADVLGLTSKSGPLRSGSQVPILTSTTVEITIPQTFLGHVHGENNSNLTQIQQISGAKVLIHDPKPGAMEGVVIVSGTTEQTHAAQCLIQAFILCGQTPP
ncbi:KH domain-containing protein HEN4 [Castanea sativa]|uniref:KH domain-containing protein HEN4 n=1 Tax=Castanea sativa TaxID=21020 RepID=UPI003F651BD9